MNNIYMIVMDSFHRSLEVSQLMPTYSFYICTSWSGSHSSRPRDRPCSSTKPWHYISTTWPPTQSSHLFTSSADWAMKKPTVLAGILVPRGLMEILASAPSSGLTSRASRSSLSLTKQSLGAEGERSREMSGDRLTLPPGRRSCRRSCGRGSRCTSHSRSLSGATLR